MQNRERGAAHINIFYFLVAMVLFLGSLWFGYVQMSQVNDAITKRKTAEINEQIAKRDLEHYKHYVEEVSNLLGAKGDWVGKAGWKWDDRFPRVASANGTATPTPIAGVSLATDLSKSLKGLAQSLGIPDTEASPLAPFFGQIDLRYKAQVQQVATADAARQKAATDLSTQTGTYQGNLSTAQQQATAATANFNKQMNDLRTANTSIQTRLRNSESEVGKVNGEKQALVEQHQEDMNTAQKRLDRQKGQNSALVATLKLRNTPEESDGEVISASMRTDTGFINIGVKDMLRRGTKFRITNRDGKLKGYGEVVKTMQDRSEIRISGVVDRVGDPIGQGDRLFNALYSPNLKRNVAMIGRFSHPYTKPMIKTLLERLGNKVYNKVEVGVDLVIVGMQQPNEDGSGLEPVEKTPGYLAAQQLGCEIITIQKIRDLLKLGE
jgi:hypothetical protein